MKETQKRRKWLAQITIRPSLGVKQRRFARIFNFLPIYLVHRNAKMIVCVINITYIRKQMVFD